MIYVKTHLRKFNSSELLERKIIPYPKNLLITKNVPHQKEVSMNNAYIFYGTLIDYYLRANLNYKHRCIIGTERTPIAGYPYNNWRSSSKEVYNTVCKDYKDKRGTIPWNDLNFDHISLMVNNISEQFRSPLLKGIKFNEFYSFPVKGGYLCGRPDIVTDECILDIKTTSNLSLMAEEAYLQLLIYYVMEKKLNPMSKIKYIGLVLPLNNEIKLLNMVKWDHRNFLKMVCSNF